MAARPFLRSPKNVLSYLPPHKTLMLLVRVLCFIANICYYAATKTRSIISPPFMTNLSYATTIISLAGFFATDSHRPDSLHQLQSTGYHSSEYCRHHRG